MQESPVQQSFPAGKVFPAGEISNGRAKLPLSRIDGRAKLDSTELAEVLLSRILHCCKLVKYLIAVKVAKRYGV